MWMSLSFELLLVGLPLPISKLLRAVGALPPVPGPTAPPFMIVDAWRRRLVQLRHRFVCQFCEYSH